MVRELARRRIVRAEEVENRWRAQRYGIEKSLVDFGKSKLVSYKKLADELDTGFCVL